MPQAEEPLQETSASSNFASSNGANAHQFVLPGQQVSSLEGGYMRGHGTYSRTAENEGGSSDLLVASVAGSVELLNKLVTVHPIKCRYEGEIGDVVVGRVTQVQQKRWKVDVNSRLDANLSLQSVNLPGGELRRKSEEDERMMRQYLQEGDLISAEVQNKQKDGTLALHTRSLRYGKLSQGVLVTVSSWLIRRRKTHYQTLPCGATLIIGKNGYVWISPAVGEGEAHGGYVQDLNEVVCAADRKVICRLANCVSLLAAGDLPIYDTTIMKAFDLSLDYQVKEMLQAEITDEIAAGVRKRLEEEN